MTAENINDCVQIGHQEDPAGNPTLQEYLVNIEGRAFTIEVVGVPLNPSLARDINEERVPPLAVPAKMLANPNDVCDFILSSPFKSIEPHLVMQDDLSSEIEGSF